jgi:hypothetical protein
MKLSKGYNEIEIDNQWVVPYNPLLSKMFNSHINIEWCHLVFSIKYICKYINKGSDQAVFAVQGKQEKQEKQRACRFMETINNLPFAQKVNTTSEKTLNIVNSKQC